jgi:hypothetical protein
MENSMAKKIKLPKRVLGVKIPKMLRKSDLLENLLNTHTGRKIIAESLTAAAAAASAALMATKTETGEKATSALGDAGAKGTDILKDAVRSATGAMTDAIGNAAKNIMPESKPGSEPKDKVGDIKRRAGTQAH